MRTDTALSSAVLASPARVDRVAEVKPADSFSRIFDQIPQVGVVPETNAAPAGIMAGGCVAPAADAVRPEAKTSTTPVDAGQTPVSPQVLIYDPVRTTATSTPTVPQDRPSDTTVVSLTPVRDSARPMDQVLTAPTDQSMVAESPERKTTLTANAAGTDIWANLDQIKRA